MKDGALENDENNFLSITERKAKINKLLEAILEDFIEILNYLKYSENRKQELQSLIFAKKRAINICNGLQKICVQLIRIKYERLGDSKERAKMGGFKRLFQQ